jgi:hypothetical protein
MLAPQPCELFEITGFSARSAVKLVQHLHDAIAVPLHRGLAFSAAVAHAVEQAVKHPRAVPDHRINRAGRFAKDRQMHEKRAVRLARASFIGAKVIGARRSIRAAGADLGTSPALNVG